MSSRWSEAWAEARSRLRRHGSTAWPRAGQDVHGEATFCAALVAPPRSRPRRRLRHRPGVASGSPSSATTAPAWTSTVDARRGRGRGRRSCLGGGRPRRRSTCSPPGSSRSTSSWPPGNVVPLVAAGQLSRRSSPGWPRTSPTAVCWSPASGSTGHTCPAAGLLALADYDAWCAAAGLTLVRRLATGRLTSTTAVVTQWHPRASQ